MDGLGQNGIDRQGLKECGFSRSIRARDQHTAVCIDTVRYRIVNKRMVDSLAMTRDSSSYIHGSVLLFI